MIQVAMFDPDHFQPLEDFIVRHSGGFGTDSACPQRPTHWRIAQNIVATWGGIYVLLPRLVRVGSKETLMATAHVTTLKSRHAQLDARIHAEERRPAPDTALLARLKKEKLRLKDELEVVH